MNHNMNHNTRTLWTVHARDAEDAALFLHHNMIAFGWPEMGDLSALAADKEAFREAFRTAYPDESAVERATAGNLLFRLLHEMRSGDALVFPHENGVYLGTVSGPYAFDSTLGQCRGVRWVKRLPRDDFSRDAMRETGASPMRLYEVKRFAGDFLSALGDSRRGQTPRTEQAPSPPSTADSGTQPAAQTGGPVSVTDESLLENPSGLLRFILDALRGKLTRDTFPDFTADLLRAMGYQVEEADGNGGADFAAVRDTLLPRVLVRAKAGRVEEADIAALEREIHAGEYGILFTLADFPEEIRQSLDDAPGLRGVAGTELASLTLEFYPALEGRYRRMIPLRTIYLPAT